MIDGSCKNSFHQLRFAVITVKIQTGGGSIKLLCRILISTFANFHISTSSNNKKI
jgi:hypothetical protein